ncbi:MAG: L-threonylcarbamoyladenylate synthase [Myxococcota bacterium]
MKAKTRSQLVAVSVAHPEPRRMQKAAEHLAAGRVVGYPTDTLYALAADPDSYVGTQRLYRLRGLPAKKPLSLICSSFAQISKYTVLSDDCFRYMKRVLPGPYTFVLRASKAAPRLADNKRKTVGVRFPEAPVAVALVEALGRPLLSTTATEPGEVSDPREVVALFGGHDVPVVLDAGLVQGTPSTVIDWSDDEPEVLREGAGPLLELAS